MTNEQIAERLDRFESIGKALEELIIQHSVSLGSIRDSLLESAPLLQLDPELETRIHRNEETMIDRHIDDIQFKTSTSSKVENVHSYVFNYIYFNYSYVNSLLQADKQSYELAGNKYNEIYYESLWAKSNLFTNRLLEESSKTLAGLIYTAWIEAGKPKIPASLGE